MRFLPHLVVMMIIMSYQPLCLSAQSPAEAPIIPRRAIFADDDRFNVRLSPDGTKIIYLAPVDGVMGAWMIPVSGPSKAELLFKLSDMSAPNLQWVYTSQHLVYAKRSPKETRLLVFDLAGGHLQDRGERAGRLVRLLDEHRVGEHARAHPADGKHPAARIENRSAPRGQPAEGFLLTRGDRL